MTALTALLVYFGWRRSATHARLLGIDESILGMSTRDYVLRSVGPVLTLLLGVGACGLAWVRLDRFLKSRIRRGEAAARRVLSASRVCAVALPLLMFPLNTIWPAGAFVLFPASVGLLALGLFYSGHLERVASLRRHPEGSDGGTRLVTQACVVVLVAVSLFWTASNYAEVLGIRLATDFVDGSTRLPGAVVYSERRLHLEGPGVVESDLGGTSEAGDLRYRYSGLGLLEHTGGRYFLVSEGWSPSYGTVFSLRDDDASLRVDFGRPGA